MNLSLLSNHRRGVSIPLPTCGTLTYTPPWALLLNTHCHHQPSSICSTSLHTHPFPLGHTSPGCRHPAQSPGSLYASCSCSSWDLDCKSREWMSVRGGMWTSLPVLCLYPSPAVCEKRTNRTFNSPCLCTRPAMAGAARELSDALVALLGSQDSKGRVTDCILALGSCVGQTAL